MNRSLRRFIGGLSTFVGVCQGDISSMRGQERSLQTSYRALESSVQRSLLGASKGQSAKAHVSPLELRTRLRPDEQRLRLPPLEARTVPSAPSVDVSQLHPMPFPVRHYAMRAVPCPAAARFYRPRARVALQEERFEVIDDYLRFPNEGDARRLDGQIDPVLHVGSFGPNEFKWSGKVPTQVL